MPVINAINHRKVFLRQYYPPFAIKTWALTRAKKRAILLFGVTHEIVAGGKESEFDKLKGNIQKCIRHGPKGTLILEYPLFGGDVSSNPTKDSIGCLWAQYAFEGFSECVGAEEIKDERWVMIGADARKAIMNSEVRAATLKYRDAKDGLAISKGQSEFFAGQPKLVEGILAYYMGMTDDKTCIQKFYQFITDHVDYKDKAAMIEMFERTCFESRVYYAMIAEEDKIVIFEEIMKHYLQELGELDEVPTVQSIMLGYKKTKIEAEQMLSYFDVDDLASSRTEGSYGLVLDSVICNALLYGSIITPCHEPRCIVSVFGGEHFACAKAIFKRLGADIDEDKDSNLNVF